MSTPEPFGCSRKRLIALLVAFTVVSSLAFLTWRRVSNVPPTTTGSTVLLLDDCDSDFKNPPFEDAVKTFGPQSKLVKAVGDLNIAQTVGGCRALAVSPDGSFYLVCENVADKLTAFETKTGKKLWSLAGQFRSAVISKQGMAYVSMSDGTIYGKGVVIIDRAGEIVKQKGDVSGFEVALDNDSETLWLAGADIKRCNLELEVLMTCDPIGWCAVSLDVDGDGSIWAAERSHPNVSGSKDRLLRISPKGEILKSIDLDWSPLCVRVDRTEGSVWATGVRGRPNRLSNLPARLDSIHLGWIAGSWLRNLLQRGRADEVTQKYNRHGKRLLQIEHGGNSIELDPADRSVWIAGLKKLWHYTASGGKLAGYGGVSDSQKWVAVATRAEEIASK